MLNVFRLLVVLCLVLAASTVSAKAGEPNINGLWRGSLFGSDVQANIERDGKDIKAVVVVHSLNGQSNTYHFFGSMQDGHMQLKHCSGHVFEGVVKSDSLITGVLTTGGGTRLDVQATRVGKPSSEKPAPAVQAEGATRRPS